MAREGERDLGGPTSVWIGAVTAAIVLGGLSLIFLGGFGSSIACREYNADDRFGCTTGGAALAWCAWSTIPVLGTLSYRARDERRLYPLAWATWIVGLAVTVGLGVLSPSE